MRLGGPVSEAGPLAFERRTAQTLPHWRSVGGGRLRGCRGRFTMVS